MRPRWQTGGGWGGVGGRVHNLRVIIHLELITLGYLLPQAWSLDCDQAKMVPRGTQLEDAVINARMSIAGLHHIHNRKKNDIIHD